MKITGNYTIDAPRDQVWAALNDIEVLARIVPGCERLEEVGENEFEGTVKIGIQSIRGIYNGRIRIEDMRPPEHYRLVAHGRSANGVVDGSGEVDLVEQNGQTILTYEGNANVGGTLASVGQRLIQGAARQLINQSLKALTEQINIRMGRVPAPAAAPATSAEPRSSASSAAAPAVQTQAATTTQNGSGDEPAATQPPEPPQPAPAAQPAAQEAAERRTVIVPEHEQLRPETVVSGVIDDFLRERPWFPWVVAALLLGYLIGRSRR